MRFIILVIFTLLAPCLINIAATNPSAQGQDKALMALVEKKDLPIEVEVSGTFEAEDKTRIAVEPEEYSGDLIIKHIIEEGVPVREGDLLMEFEVDALTKAITKAENGVDDAGVKLQKAEADLASLQIDHDVARKQTAMKLALAERAVKAEEAKISHKIEEKETEIRRKETALKDKEVNFEQLKKLYDNRDLHTDTEAILVERESKSIEEERLNVKNLIRDFEHFKKYELDEELEKKKLELLKEEGEKSKQELKFAAEIAEKEGDVKKAKRKLEEAEGKVADLNKDLENLKVTSPRDGLVFYGTINNNDMFGNVVVFGGSSLRQNLRIGGRVQTHSTLLTVASMERLSVEMKVLENDIQHMRAGLAITLRPDAFPDLEIKGRIDNVDQVASRGDFFSSVQEFKVKASYEGTYPQLRAGMNCRVTVHADNIPDAIQVPVIAVFEEDNDYYCYLDESGSASKRMVKLGATDGMHVQITEGLRANDKVYLYNPFRD